MKDWGLRQRISLLVLGFTAAAFGGWLYEEVCIYILYHHLYNRGMLHLTICPIYGFGAWGLYALFHKVRNAGAFFVLCTVFASIFEYACSYLLELVFHRSFWSYSDWILSVNDRISLISSLIFGLLALFFAKKLLPFLTRIVKNGSVNGLFVCSLLLVCMMAGDFLLVLCGV